MLELNTKDSSLVSKPFVLHQSSTTAIHKFPMNNALATAKPFSNVEF